MNMVVRVAEKEIERLGGKRLEINASAEEKELKEPPKAPVKKR